MRSGLIFEALGLIAGIIVLTLGIPIFVSQFTFIISSAGLVLMAGRNAYLYNARGLSPAQKEEVKQLLDLRFEE